MNDIANYETFTKIEPIHKGWSSDKNMSQPIDFGVCNAGKSVYQILTWCDGEEAKELLPSLPEKEQYDFGWEAGQMMLKMQTVESYPPSSDWGRKRLTIQMR